jgi:hypothetical protein
VAEQRTAASPSAITINPSASGRAVVVRGPATLGADAGETKRGRASVDIDEPVVRSEVQPPGDHAVRLIDAAPPALTGWTNRRLLFHMVFGSLIVRTLMPWSTPWAGWAGAAGSPPR